MDIQAISTSAFSVFLTGEELRGRHMSIGTLSAEDAALLLHAALDCIGVAEHGAIQIELFPGRDGVILFARLTSSEPAFFSFSDTEVLIAAACSCRDTPPASLIYIDGKYVLTVHPWCGDAVPAPLWEFGTPLYHPPEYELHLQEHGHCILERDALSILQRTFSVA